MIRFLTPDREGCLTNMGTITKTDLQWIRHFLNRCVVHGDEQEQLFRIVNKLDFLLERGANGSTGQPERSDAA